MHRQGQQETELKSLAESLTNVQRKFNDEKSKRAISLLYVVFAMNRDWSQESSKGKSWNPCGGSA